MNTTKTILIFTDWYYPAYKAGGPVQSVVNLVNLLSRYYSIKIVCRDRDLNENYPFQGIETNVWIALAENQQIMYLNPNKNRFKDIKSLVYENRNNILYINGIYSLKFSVLPALLGFYYNIDRTFISVRGMLHKSALSVKPVRKQIFLALFRGLGIYKKVTMLATDHVEAEEIKRSLGQVKVSIAPNIPMQPEVAGLRTRVFKQDDARVSFLFLGRIAPEKNPVQAVLAFKEIRVPTVLHLCGSDYADAYSNQFKEAISLLPSNIEVNIHAELPHRQISALIHSCDILVLPSKGENFGHAIFESLLHGLPVIIGNNTPWKGIENQKAGIEVDPDNITSIQGAIEFFNGMDAETYAIWSHSARNKALEYLRSNNFEEIYRKLFS